MIKLYSPGLKYYIQRIKQGPFSFVRYNDGEWKVMVPKELLKPSQQIVYSDEAECAILRNTVIDCHRSNDYLMTMWPEIKLKQWDVVREWIVANVPRWIKWYDSKPFLRAAWAGQLFPLVKAIRKQPLPVIVIGPETLSKLPLNIAHHVVTPSAGEWPRLWFERDRLEEEILAFGKPAFISFSANCATKVMIHDLWPKIGQHSHMIDFGSLWECLCGYPVRGYHTRLNERKIRMNLHGR